MNLDDEHIDALAGRLGPLLEPPEEEADLALLEAWRAGELDEADTARAEALLAADPAARAFIDEFEEAPSAFLQAWAVKQGVGAVRRPRKWVTPVFTLVAMAAAVALFVMRPTVEPPPGYAVFDVVGAQKLTRGEDPTRTDPAAFERLRVDDEATLVLILKPGDDLDAKASETIAARVFVDEGGKLTPAGAQGQFGDGGAWTLEAPSAQVFGERLGQRKLRIAFAFDEGVLDGLAGDPLPTAQSDGGVRWLSIDVEYVDREEGSK